MTQVLISANSIEEAESIMHTGTDVIDVKNVKEGSLGAQFPWLTKGVVDMAKPTGIRISATLGDLPFKPGTAALAAYGSAMTGASYIKAGLYGMNTYDEAREMMDGIRQAIRIASDDAIVVAAGYADYRRFDGVSTADLVRAAHDAKCDLVMVDTAIKDGKNLFDAMSYDEIEDFVSAAHKLGLMVALAGSIKLDHVPMLFDLEPDVIGVRGAVCGGPNRHTKICPHKTEEFVNYVHAGKQTGEIAASA